MELAIAAEFAMMTHVGLFTLTGDRYQFTVPDQEPAIEELRWIAGKLAEQRSIVWELVETADTNFMTYPEQFITAMPHEEAEQWGRRLSAMDEDRRCADRAVLLGIGEN